MELQQQLTELKNQIQDLTDLVRNHQHKDFDLTQKLTSADISFRRLNAGGTEIIVRVGEDPQLAINEINNTATGGTVIFAKGTHYLTKSLTLYDKVSMRGQGRDSTILDFGSGAFGVNYIGTSSVIKTNFVISDLTIQNSNNAAGIDIDFCDFWRMENMRVTSCDQGGVRVQRSRDFFIDNVASDTNTGIGFQVLGDSTRSSLRFTLLGCRTDTNSAGGYYITASNANTVAQYSVINCGARADGGAVGGEDAFNIGGSGRYHYANFIGCYANGCDGDGFDCSANEVSFIGCIAESTTLKGFNLTGIATKTSCLSIPGTRNALDTNVDQKYLYARNTSGGTLAVGDVVVFKTGVATGDEVTTTTTQGDDYVLGMTLVSTINNNFGYFLVMGLTTVLKVNGTTDIAIGDFLGTFTTAGIAMKAAAGDMCFAIALEAYTGNDSLGVIDALLFSPRLI